MSWARTPFTFKRRKVVRRRIVFRLVPRGILEGMARFCCSVRREPKLNLSKAAWPVDPARGTKATKMCNLSLLSYDPTVSGLAIKAFRDSMVPLDKAESALVSSARVILWPRKRVVGGAFWRTRGGRPNDWKMAGDGRPVRRAVAVLWLGAKADPHAVPSVLEGKSGATLLSADARWQQRLSNAR